MGRNKLLLPYRGRTIIEETTRQLAHADIDDLIVVTGHEGEQITRCLVGYAGDRLTLIRNSRYNEGRAESIKCALRAIGEDAAAALFMVGDKPGVSTALINRAIARFRQDRPGILYIKTPAGRGHPIIFARRMFAQLQALTGDSIGNHLIAENAGAVVELEDDRVQIDIDTMEDYRRLIAEASDR